MSNDLQACADLVARGDYTRLRATMAAPPKARLVLFPLFAFNLEVARAPWVTQQPTIAEMRLQWWIDALGEIATQETVRRHEVVTALAQVLTSETVPLLQDLVAARRWDIYQEPFENEADFEQYIDQTSGNLLVVATELLGSADSQVVRDFAFAVGLANWFQAVPHFLEQNRQPLLHNTPAALQRLAQQGLKRLARARQTRTLVSQQAGLALLCGWQTKAYLAEVVASPERVLSGLLGPSANFSKIQLLLRSVFGRW